jgi:GAF domain-containing protein
LDITERKRAEEALELRVRLEYLAATIGFALVHADTIGQGLQQSAEAIIHYTGAAFARIWTRNEETGEMQLEASAGMHTDTYGPHACVPIGQFVIGQIAQLSEPHLSNDVPNDPDICDREWAKQEGMVGFAGYPLTLDGRTVGVAAAFSRKPFGEPIPQAFASVSIQLAQFVTRKRAELQLLKAKEAAEAASRAQSDYLANMNHEIRNALNGIIGMTDAVLATELNPHQRDDLHFVLESANSLLKIVDGVPDFFKIAER